MLTEPAIAFAELMRADTLENRRRFYETLLTSKVYVHLTDDPRPTVNGLRLADGTLALHAFLDEHSARRSLTKRTKGAEWSAVVFFRAAVAMKIDAVIINPPAPALRINRGSITALAMGLNPASVTREPNGSN